MNIRTKFIIIGFLSLVVGVVFGGFVFYSSFTAAKVEAREATAQELVRAVFQRNLLLSDYLLNRSERAKEQLLAQNKEIGDILLEAFFVFDNGDSVDALAQIQKNYDGITFELESLFISEETRESTGSLADIQIILSSILVRSQSTVDLASQVASRSSAQLTQLRQGAVASVGVFSIGGVVFSMIAVLIIVSTTRKLSVFEKSAANIAKGKLDERVNIQGKDEVGVLAQAFNAMAEKLQGSYADLEQKIANRTKAFSANIKELEKTKAATLNILEDLQQERDKVALQLQTTKRFQEAVNASTDGVIMTNLKQQAIYINKAAQHLIGYTEQKVLGKNVTRDFVSGHTPKKVIEQLQKTIQEGKSFTTEKFIIQTKKGNHVPVELSVFPIKEGEKVMFYVGILQDITKRTEIDKAKTEFVSLASHQLRTPLSAINWYTEMLLAGDGGKITKTQKKYLGEVYAGSQRMVELVNALLDVSRLEMGTFSVEPKPIHIEEIAQSVHHELKPQIDARNLKLNTKQSKNIPTIVADPKLVRMIFQNLLSNAVKYTPGGGSVTLDLQTQKKGTLVAEKKVTADSIAITIADTGYGIPQEQQDKIFTKLFRADNVKEKETEGTGLGLYIIKSIIDHAGGMIWFESKENKGTTFYVLLPTKGMQAKQGAKKLGN